MRPAHGIRSRLSAPGAGFPGRDFVVDHRGSVVLIAVSHFQPFGCTAPPLAMASADFPLRLVASSFLAWGEISPGMTRQRSRSRPKEFPARHACRIHATPSVQVPGVDLSCCLTPTCRFVSASCSSGQHLQTARPWLPPSLPPLPGGQRTFSSRQVRPAGRTRKSRPQAAFGTTEPSGLTPVGCQCHRLRPLGTGKTLGPVAVVQAGNLHRLAGGRRVDEVAIGNVDADV